MTSDNQTSASASASDPCHHGQATYNCAKCYVLIGLTLSLPRLVQSCRIPLQLPGLPSPNPTDRTVHSSPQVGDLDNNDTRRPGPAVAYYPSQLVLCKPHTRTRHGQPSSQRKKLKPAYMLREFLGEPSDHRILAVNCATNVNVRRRRRVSLRRLVREYETVLRGPS